MVVGDARLSLERQSPQSFDVLVVDAFSGGSIPVHLLTREAFALYFSHLKPNGTLAVNTSNKYLNLAPIVKLAADHFGKEAKLVDSYEDEAKAVNDASWVLITNKHNLMLSKALDGAAVDIETDPRLKGWTDDYSSVFSVLNISLVPNSE